MFTKGSTRVLPVWLLLSLAAGACAQGSSDLLTPTVLNDKAAALSGSAVLARGWLDYGFEKRFLYERPPSGAPSDSPYDHSCVSLEVPEALRAQFEKLNHGYVVIEGTFQADIAAGRVFLGLCNTTGIRVSSVKRGE